MSQLVVLGATGSIGRQTIDVAKRLEIPIAVLAAARPSDTLAQLATDHPDADIALAADSAEARDRFDHLGPRVSYGAAAVTGAAAMPNTIVVNGIVGAAGLAPTIAALESGNRVALANKESLVAGGPVVKAAVAGGKGELIPVDSEHSALWQCLIGEPAGAASKLTLTASGGPFRGKTRADLASVSVAEALAHPTWDMGPRITIDSSTLVNKAFEVIEAHHLFDVGYEMIDVVVHPQSVVHSLVEFTDGSIKAHLGDPDMRIPIQYAITYPDRVEGVGVAFDLTKRDLVFEAPDRATFRGLDLGYEAGKAGGSSPAVFNAADEIAVAAFLDGKIEYLDIISVVEAALAAVPWREVATVDDVLAADAEARALTRELIAKA